MNGVRTLRHRSSRRNSFFLLENSLERPNLAVGKTLDAIFSDEKISKILSGDIVFGESEMIEKSENVPETFLRLLPRRGRGGDSDRDRKSNDTRS